MRRFAAILRLAMSAPLVCCLPSFDTFHYPAEWWWCWLLPSVRLLGPGLKLWDPGCCCLGYHPQRSWDVRCVFARIRGFFWSNWPRLASRGRWPPLWSSTQLSLCVIRSFPYWPPLLVWNLLICLFVAWPSRQRITFSSARAFGWCWGIRANYYRLPLRQRMCSIGPGISLSQLLEVRISYPLASTTSANIDSYGGREKSLAEKAKEASVLAASAVAPELVKK